MKCIRKLDKILYNSTRSNIPEKYKCKHDKFLQVTPYPGGALHGQRRASLPS
ncbi:hypothetical protein TPE_2128 [Treponema pedis str. T A4]|uniref:Uncharacterized protein n=1 Tax=Treponema pedis str. T A4 TaxID=1291379 RepID=S5ZPR9_9SPIR|nr:hypothetical protein TPE_2128 [Treponema pedis str. T A4]